MSDGDAFVTMKPINEQPTFTERELVQMAWNLIDRAQRAGLVITIERRSLQPLAMGNHEPVVEIRAARGSNGGPKA